MLSYHELLFCFKICERFRMWHSALPRTDAGHHRLQLALHLARLICHRSADA